ncbi:ADP-ribosylglycohydrolase family protein [Methylobacterium sp. WSM2598]|uniref:ADP-ribosylglycohydrolase family protein n=1 Tax=Methylobacterium sp. WSM2598 TaxID=398261 RepID=UPI00036C4402|nr:ADP-ribosylglycohydrolase family protein [Methylobacterium sp. WSM2598]
MAVKLSLPPLERTQPVTQAADTSPAVLGRAQGTLLGLAVGDALGSTLEFVERDTQPLHTEMLGGGPFDLEPGQWTDDTAMALALADSLIDCSGLDPHDLATRFVRWWQNGAYSCTDTCFDIGITTSEALARFVRTGQPYAGSTHPRSAGNGSLMRLAPVALFSLNDPERADQLARDQSRVTHAAPQAVEACAYFVQLLREAILGQPDVLRSRTWSSDSAVAAIAAGSWRQKSRDQLRSSGYVIDTLEAALWAVGTTTSFEDALILAVNLGEDADTVGAVAGQLAGALYGAAAIPERWLQPLAWRDRITRIADQLRPFCLVSSASSAVS